MRSYCNNKMGMDLLCTWRFLNDHDNKVEEEEEEED
jgi:hypothetical protein